MRRSWITWCRARVKKEKKGENVLKGYKRAGRDRKLIKCGLLRLCCYATGLGTGLQATRAERNSLWLMYLWYTMYCILYGHLGHLMIFFFNQFSAYICIPFLSLLSSGFNRYHWNYVHHLKCINYQVKNVNLKLLRSRNIQKY